MGCWWDRFFGVVNQSETLCSLNSRKCRRKFTLRLHHEGRETEIHGEPWDVFVNKNNLLKA